MNEPEIQSGGAYGVLDVAAHVLEIPRSELLNAVCGTATATRAPENDLDLVVERITAFNLPGNVQSLQASTQQHAKDRVALSSEDWLAIFTSQFSRNEAHLRQVAELALAAAILRIKSRFSVITPSDLEYIWILVYSTLTRSTFTQPYGIVSRSAQGFFSIPILSVVKNGNIDELIRLHVWLPDGHRGNPDFAIHAHQPFAQSWVIAGKGVDHAYDVQAAAHLEDVTHAQYCLEWHDGKLADTKYKTHQAHSTVLNTHNLVHAKSTSSTSHGRDTSYTVQHGRYHATEVSPDVLHATLFYFDSQRGFEQHAGVLGPRDSDSFTQLRDPGAMTAATLADMVHLVRCWEEYMLQGQECAHRADWESALRQFNKALAMCNSAENFPNASRYRGLALGEMGSTNTRFGRYDQAKEMLEKAIAALPPSSERVVLSGDLGVVYRHMNRLEDARDAFQSQYDTAKQLSFVRPACRAVGNLGMVNYQLAQQNSDTPLLELAISQLEERVQSARDIKADLRFQADADAPSLTLRQLTTWEAIGLSRLSLCYSASSRLQDAVAAALESLTINCSSEDSTVVAVSRFFYGRALLLIGKHQEAMEQLEGIGTCTPAIAFCKEPSSENREYLKELVKVGANFDSVDEHGYSAMDYTVFNGDTETENLVIEGLRTNMKCDIDSEIVRRHSESKLRKGYREIFQEKLRPALIAGLNTNGRVASLRKLRKIYADCLDADNEKASLFDRFWTLPYSDFLQFGRLPRSSDGLAGSFRSDTTATFITDPDFVIFFSYRWINTRPGAVSPDEEDNRQYKRMIQATEQYLLLHPSINRQTLGIWMDFACVNQDDPMAGVSALPMNLAQCDVVISLVGDDYYERAWCSVEVMMIQHLKKAYNIHQWYEHAQIESANQTDETNKEYELRDGPVDKMIIMSEKKLSFESDRSKVLFLEKQSRLLG